MRLCLAFLTTLVLAGSASAACYELIGCTDVDRFAKGDLRQLSCENLWYVRNSIYDENGYCFKTSRAQAQFDSADCWVRDQAKVKLSVIESQNVGSIAQVERERGCPK
ncbi:YARHG domain-containing protein [Aquibium sp. LZ166]|uniref:YARHG domain-containing protein n=1 Tax=Aquibium pacificus TaxID=3153579 RepID=A0ABV3SRS2_9HYPH